MEQRHWQDWLTGAIGLWLIVSPFLLGFTPPEGVAAPYMEWNFVIVGVLVLLLAAVALSAFSVWEEWVGGVLGVWLVVSP